MAARQAKDNAKKAALNDKVRKAHQARRDRVAQNQEDKKAKVRDTKAAIGEWEGTANAKREAHLENAREKARRRAAEKANARERSEQRMKQKRAAAREEKANNAVATKALDDEVRKNQLSRAKSYARRYVPTEQVETLEASDTFRRLYGLPDAEGKIKSVSRPLPGPKK